jgi:hypothetical protein
MNTTITRLVHNFCHLIIYIIIINSEEIIGYQLGNMSYNAELRIDMTFIMKVMGSNLISFHICMGCEHESTQYSVGHSSHGTDGWDRWS